jgi:hypothetical protein
VEEDEIKVNNNIKNKKMNNNNNFVFNDSDRIIKMRLFVRR